MLVVVIVLMQMEQSQIFGREEGREGEGEVMSSLIIDREHMNSL